MQAPFRNRHIISILSALVLHVILVLMLGLVDLDRDLSDDKRLGPVAVRFEPLPSETLPRPAEAEPEEVPEAERSQAQPAAEDQQPADQATDQSANQAAPEEESQAAQAPQASPQASERQETEEEWTIPTPSGRSWEEPRTERRRTPSPQTTEQEPASESLEGRRERSPSSEAEDQRSEGSRIVYGEQEQSDQSDAGRSRDEAAAPDETQPDQSESVFSDETLQDLESVQRSGETDPADRTGGEGQGQSGPAPDTGSSPIDVELEGSHTRRLDEYSLPELTEEELAELPGRIAVEVSFTLPPNGRPTALNTAVSSGYPEIDQKVMQAVIRTWRFSQAPQDAEAVNGRARIIIRAAE